MATRKRTAGEIIGERRGELLNREIIGTLLEAQVLVGGWRRHYNALRPHSALGYRPPAPETVLRQTGNVASTHQMVPVRVP